VVETKVVSSWAVVVVVVVVVNVSEEAGRQCMLYVVVKEGNALTECCGGPAARKEGARVKQ